jgi:sulfide:quinone oxidoreductase
VSRRILIAGGGVAALETALALGDLAGERVQIELVAPEPVFSYRALAVGEPFGMTESPRYDLGAIAADRGWTLTLGTLASVDPARREARTTAGDVHVYSALVLALGAIPEPALPGALTFAGPADAEPLAVALRTVKGRVAFVATDPGWTLPLYELALMTTRWARAGARDLEVVVITPEGRPLGVFGAPAAAVVEEALAAQGIALRTASVATEVADGAVHIELEGPLRVELAVALPRLRGPALPGVPHDERGFVAVDRFGRVEDAPGVFAVGDMTTRVLRQGGLAAQQAEAAASALAAETGADVTPVPYEPVLRGMLLTGAEPLYLRRGAGPGWPATASEGEPLWWPPHKIVARRLGPYLAAHPELVLPATHAA